MEDIKLPKGKPDFSLSIFFEHSLNLFLFRTRHLLRRDNNRQSLLKSWRVTVEIDLTILYRITLS